MSAGIEIYNYVSNQKGSPALYSDILANRPAAGFLGRLFISTDTLEIYRDTGTAWALISGGGGSVNIYNSDGTLTAARTVTMAGHNLTFEGGAGTNRIRMSADAGQPRIFSFASANVARWAFRVDGAETGSNAGGDWALRAYNDAGSFTFAPITANRKTGEKTLFAQANITAGTEAVTSVFNIAGITYASGLTMIGGNAHAAQFNNFTLANSGSLTFANSSFVGANGNVLRLQANNSGTITMQAATPGLRTAAVSLNQIQYNTTNGSAITYTHAAIIQGLGILQLFAAGSLTVTNAYGLLLNDLNEYGYPSTGAGALSITNRWGIYQDSTTDANYLGGSVLIGTTTNAGFKTDINGTFRAVSTVTLSSLGGVGTRMVVADASGVLSTQAIPGGGGISGSGTTNYVAKFTGASSIGNSQVFDDGTNVGIGTITPTVKLQIEGPSGAGGSVLFQTARASGFGSTELFQYYVTGGADYGSNFGINVSSATNGRASIIFKGNSLASSGELIFNTNNTNRVQIFSGGNVGINTTTDAGYKTDIAGTLRSTQSAYFATASGSVGVGTTTPTQKLSVSGTGQFTQNAGNVNGTIQIQHSGVQTWKIGVTNDNTSSLVFGNDLGGSFVNKLLYLTNAGNVAIGSATAAVKLHVYGTGNVQRIESTNTGGAFLDFRNSGISSLGYVGVEGNTGGVTITGTLANATFIGSGATGTPLQFATAGSVKSTIFANGNNAIGSTTDSGQRLQVAGTARIYGTALPHLLIEQTAATGNVELQFTATDASYPAIIRSKAAQSIAFKDGTNSNLDIYSAGQLSIGGGGAPFGSTNTLTVLAGTAPTATASDCFTLYSKDITAGNAAPHFITENGAIVKIYQETTSVAAAAFTANSGTAINDASTFDGYTLRQIVKALRNLGILQ